MIVVIMWFIWNKTTFGKNMFALGSNEEAARVSGVNVFAVTMGVFALAGAMYGFTGFIEGARIGSNTVNTGLNYEMDAIGSCFIGGASAYGGTGTVPGVIVGAVLMGVINLGMSLMGVDQNMQKVVKGLVLLAAVIFDVVSKRGGKLIAKN